MIIWRNLFTFVGVQCLHDGFGGRQGILAANSQRCLEVLNFRARDLEFTSQVVYFFYESHVFLVTNEISFNKKEEENYVHSTYNYLNRTCMIRIFSALCISESLDSLYLSEFTVFSKWSLCRAYSFCMSWSTLAASDFFFQIHQLFIRPITIQDAQKLHYLLVLYKTKPFFFLAIKNQYWSHFSNSLSQSSKSYHIVADMLLIDRFYLLFKHFKILYVSDTIVNVGFDLL